MHDRPNQAYLSALPHTPKRWYEYPYIYGLNRITGKTLSKSGAPGMTTHHHGNYISTANIFQNLQRNLIQDIHVNVMILFYHIIWKFGCMIVFLLLSLNVLSNTIMLIFKYNQYLILCHHKILYQSLTCGRNKMAATLCFFVVCTWYLSYSKAYKYSYNQALTS